ncbi:MAG: ABC transporter permease [Planctomycetota bacterium]|jgi:NitT/TauT family transport system permease protein/sulfonate transport system permease protein|nr:ABC transporter permease [Planctomycetota bacterium]
MGKNSLFRKLGKSAGDIAWVVGSIGGFLLLWQLSVSFTVIGTLMPGPFAVAATLMRSFAVPLGGHTIQEHAYYSFMRVIIGYGTAVALGISFGVGAGLSRWFRALFRPLFEMIRPIPTVAWIPLAILWFGVDEMSKYFIVFYGAFANVALSVYQGILGVDPVLIGAARMLGCSERQVTFKVMLPACIPYIFAGMQVGLSAGIMSVVVAEMIKSTEGIGWIIHAGQQNADMTQVLSGMVALALFGLLLATILRRVERKMCAWSVRNT